VDATGLLQALAEEHPRDALLLDGVHPTAFVHAAIAERIADRIAPWIETQIRFGRLPRSAAP
jgi:phospholipase/lecithinase/hemolysin